MSKKLNSKLVFFFLSDYCAFCAFVFSGSFLYFASCFSYYLSALCCLFCSDCSHSTSASLQLYFLFKIIMFNIFCFFFFITFSFQTNFNSPLTIIFTITLFPLLTKTEHSWQSQNLFGHPYNNFFQPFLILYKHFCLSIPVLFNFASIAIYFL